jgi:uracil-DNA glycosylase
MVGEQPGRGKCDRIAGHLAATLDAVRAGGKLGCVTTRDVTADALETLLREVRACRLCELHLPLGPRPVLRAGTRARVLIVGQAPGTRVHETGIPWNDPSGDRLRDWLQVDRAVFYDEQRFAIIPTGLCYPGRGRSGDRPPRPECAPLWHPRLRPLLPAIGLTLLVGRYAQAHYLGARRQPTLRATVRDWRGYLPEFLPLPHPSPRNTRWLQVNPWFSSEVLPELRARVERLSR